MNKVVSIDGTQIAYDREGSGPALIMVTGALATRADANRERAPLAEHFTVVTYDRRGRGESGDTLPYAVEREVEDIDALIAEAGGKAFVFGHSSGAVLSLEAARLLPGKIPRLAVYEPPFVLDGSRPPVPPDFDRRLAELVSAGQRGEAVAYFLSEAVGVPAQALAQMQGAPFWPGMAAIAPTLVYDTAVMGDTMGGQPESIQRFAAVQVPTLVMDGGNSPEFMHHAARALADVLPNAVRQQVPGLEHGVPGNVLAPLLVDFFLGG